MSLPNEITTQPAETRGNRLEYAARPPAHRRRWFRRAALIVIVLLAVGAAWKWGRPAATRASLLYHQRGCLNYVASPDQVVFDSDPVRVAALAKDPNFVISGGCAFRRLPADWQALSSRWVISPTPQAIIFVHERRAPGGARRIVAVERIAAGNESTYFIAGYDVMPYVIEPASFTKPLREYPIFSAIDVLDSVGPHTDVRIYAGQPDPADASHFTIRYESGGATHIEDGYLGDDGQVTLKRRHEAAAGKE